MTAGTSATQTWLDAITQCFQEFAETTLGIESSGICIYEAEESAADWTDHTLAGAYLALVSDSVSVQVGIVSSREGCKAISGAMLCMEAEELETLSNTDVADTVGESINILAGMVKTCMAERYPALNIGLPIFIDGQIEPIPNQQVGKTDIMAGKIPLQVVVIQPHLENA